MDSKWITVVVIVSVVGLGLCGDFCAKDDDGKITCTDASRYHYVTVITPYGWSSLIQAIALCVFLFIVLVIYVTKRITANEEDLHEDTLHSMNTANEDDLPKDNFYFPKTANEEDFHEDTFHSMNTANEEDLHED